MNLGLSLIKKRSAFFLKFGDKTILSPTKTESLKNEINQRFLNSSAEVFIFLGFNIPSIYSDLISLEGKKIIILEQDLEIIQDVLKHTELKGILDQIHLVRSFDELYTLLNKDEESLLKKLDFFVPSFYNEINPKLYEKFNSYLAKCQKSQKSHVHFKKNLASKHIQSVKSLGLLCELPFGHWMKSCFGNIPLVIVSAGPSLDDQLEILKKNREKVLIFCVFTAYKSLQKAGIEPDLILSVESKYLGYASHGVSLNNSNLLLGMWSHPEIHSLKFGHKSILGQKNDPFFEVLFPGQNVLALPHGPSVSCAAIMLAYFAGCNPVYLMGQDCAFLGEQTYSKESNYGEIKLEESGLDAKKLTFQDSQKIDHYLNEISGLGDKFEHQFVERDLFKVPSYCGDLLKTSLDLYETLDWIASFSSRTKLKDPDFKLLNSSKKGAHIKNVPYLNSSDFFSSFEERGSSEEFKRIERVQSSSVYPGQIGKKALKYFLEQCLKEIEANPLAGKIKEKKFFDSFFPLHSLFAAKEKELSGIYEKKDIEDIQNLLENALRDIRI